MRPTALRHAVVLACAAALPLAAIADETSAPPPDPGAAPVTVAQLGAENAPLETAARPRQDPAQLGSVTIIGSSAAALDIGGSAHFIGPDELEQFEYGDVHRILRAVPGVYLQDEEGFGHRPNIGIRGSGQDRSSRIALLEDGVLIAPAPYAAPAAYYFPTVRRIYAAEVLKGPAAIPVGPRTIGGALNMISTPIPSELGVYGDYFLGEDATHDAHLVAGGSNERFGMMFETIQQRSDGFKTIDDNDRNTRAGYDFDDWLVKGRINSEPGADWYQSLEVRYGRTVQDAQQSYLGLTDADYAADPYRLYAATQIDQLDAEHTSRQVSWTLEPAAKPWKLNITRYNNSFQRSWYRVNNVDGIGLSAILEDPATFAEQLAWLQGETSPDDALRARDNLRRYGSYGWQGRGEYALDAGPAALTLKAGFRFHEDYEDRFQKEDRYRMEDGNMVLTTAGAPGGQDNRVGAADVSAGFVAADIDVGAWRFSPGLRYERIELTRTDYSRTDPTRAEGPTRVISGKLSEWIPGVGVTYDLSDRVKLIGGVHEGFNPPAPGSDAGAETSTNWEFGLRYRGAWLTAEAIGFVTDYGNLVGTVTESTGGGGEIGDQFEAGEAVVRGIELLGEAVLWEFAGGWRVPVRLAWTWTPDAEFDNGFASDFDPWGEVEAGDRMPYLPENVGQLRLGLEGDRLALNLNFNYQSESRSKAGSGSIPANEKIDAATVVDLGASWALTPQLSLLARVQNLFDKEYVASRSPNGLRPGIDRLALLGVQASF
jgi:Fe(3+) dicitrate transport protein